LSAQPKKIGKYDVIGTAGKGAMGIVYIGHDPFVDRRVAIKVQRYDETEDLENTAGRKQAKRLFFSEAQSAGALDHPNILRVYDAGEADGQPYIAMEYIEGVDTLRSFCAPDRLLSIATVLQHMIACAKALDYATARG
jgi:eukaryotic-like serine/threonine-protein kinase